MTPAGIVAVEEVPLSDMVGFTARLERKGELMLVCPSDDLPASKFFHLDASEVYPLADDAIDFRVSRAWRTRDIVNREERDSVTA